jgi:16S rRNA (guanine966-N2)-methyltransferase
MRVVSGSARGIRLDAVPGDTTRPILDRVKTALFDILRPELEETRFLDLFAGSGSVGIEALSQGAKHCTFLDLEKKAIATINKNLAVTKLSSQAVVKHVDAFAFLKRSTEKFDIIYIAPPQFKQLWVFAMQHLAERPELLKDDGLIIVQIDPKEYEKLELSQFIESSKRTYGNTELIFFKKPAT